MTKLLPVVPGGDKLKKVGSFTLVEMMLALAILAIILIVLFSMLGALTSAWQAGQAHNERRTTAQIVFERMSRDLRQITLPSSRSGSPGLANTNSLEFVINPSGVSSVNEYPQAFFWQAPVATDGGAATSIGNLAIVGYFIQWVNGTPDMCRVLINPSTSSVYSNPATSAWINDSTLSANAPATSPTFAGLLAENVLALWVQALDGLGNPIQQANNPSLNGEAFDSRYSFGYTNYLYTNNGNPVPATNAAPTLPCAVQIAIVVLDSRTARLLTGTANEKPAPSTLSGNFWGDIQHFYTNLPSAIQKGAEIQTSTVEIVGGPK